MSQSLSDPVDSVGFSGLDPDFILPEQFFPDQQPNWSGEISLLWTVFSDGIETFRKEVNLGREHGEIFVETLAWVRTTGDESIFAFDRLCELFQLNPTRVRLSLLDWRDRQHAIAGAQRAA